MNYYVLALERKFQDSYNESVSTANGIGLAVGGDKK